MYQESPVNFLTEIQREDCDVSLRQMYTRLTLKDVFIDPFQVYLEEAEKIAAVANIDLYQESL